MKEVIALTITMTAITIFVLLLISFKNDQQYKQLEDAIQQQVMQCDLYLQQDKSAQCD